MSSHRDELDQYFGFLISRFGFKLIDFQDANIFDNFSSRFRRAQIEIQIIRDRGQVFIDFSVNEGPWRSKEVILERLGIPFDRFPTEHGLWNGYRIQNQSTEIATYLPRILDTLVGDTDAQAQSHSQPS